MVWYYNNALGRPQKKKIISRIKGYHGVTIAAASLTAMPYVQTDFDVPIPNIIHTGCPHYYRFAQEGESEQDFVDRLARELDELIVKEGPDTVAAFIGEPLQGAGGVLVPPQGYWEKKSEEHTSERQSLMRISYAVFCLKKKIQRQNHLN